MTNWAHVSGRLGNVKEETRSIGKEIYDAARAEGHDIWYMWGMGTSSEHRTGLALDLMVRNQAAGDWIRNYIWTNRARLRLRHVIWWQRITSTVVQPGVVRQMADRGNVTQNHKDHLHVLFLAGKYQAPDVSESTNNPSFVKKVQEAVKATPVDGKWGPVTDAHVLRMRNVSRVHRGWPTRHRATFDTKAAQAVVGTKVDGIWGPKSQTALIKWVKGFQKLLNVKVDGWWGPKTDGKLIAVRRRYLNRF